MATEHVRPVAGTWRSEPAAAGICLGASWHTLPLCPVETQKQELESQMDKHQIWFPERSWWWDDENPGVSNAELTSHGVRWSSWVQFAQGPGNRAHVSLAHSARLSGLERSWFPAKSCPVTPLWVPNVENQKVTTIFLSLPRWREPPPSPPRGLPPTLQTAQAARSLSDQNSSLG